MVPCQDIEVTVRALIDQRRQALRIREISYDLWRHNNRDSGCFTESPQILRDSQDNYEKALIIFDRHGCGRDQLSAYDIETELKEKIVRNGWNEGNIEVVVIDPEIESWIWVHSNRMAEFIGWEDFASLKSALQRQGYWGEEENKPQDPKAALEHALREKQRPHSASLYRKIAETVTLQGCEDKSFNKFLDTLRRWFLL